MAELKKPKSGGKPQKIKAKPLPKTRGERMKRDMSIANKRNAQTTDSNN